MESIIYFLVAMISFHFPPLLLLSLSVSLNIMTNSLTSDHLVMILQVWVKKREWEGRGGKGGEIGQLIKVPAAVVTHQFLDIPQCYNGSTQTICTKNHG